MMEAYIFVTVFVGAIDLGLFSASPLDDLTINLNLNESPKGYEDDGFNDNDGYEEDGFNDNDGCKGGDSCCTEGKPCKENDGDCDNNDQCEGDLVCGFNNCVWGEGDDCCFKNEGRCKGTDEGCCTAEEPCKENDGDCDGDDECEGDLVCGYNNCPWGGGDQCCTKKEKRWRDDLRCGKNYPLPNGKPAQCDRWGANPCCSKQGRCGVHCRTVRCNGRYDCCGYQVKCDEDDGDCDRDSQCMPGLLCGSSNCLWGDCDVFGNCADCCYKPGRCNGIDNGCCTESNPCDENDGDCDSDSECLSGLKCGNSNCEWGGCILGLNCDDCCYKP